MVTRISLVSVSRFSLTGRPKVTSSLAVGETVGSARSVSLVERVGVIPGFVLPRSRECMEGFASSATATE